MARGYRDTLDDDTLGNEKTIKNSFHFALMLLNTKNGKKLLKKNEFGVVK